MRTFAVMLLFVAGPALAESLPWPERPVVANTPQLQQLAEGFRWSEGPVVEPDSGDVLFTDVPQNTLYR